MSFKDLHTVNSTLKLLVDSLQFITQTYIKVLSCMICCVQPEHTLHTTWYQEHCTHFTHILEYFSSSTVPVTVNRTGVPGIRSTSHITHLTEDRSELSGIHGISCPLAVDTAKILPPRRTQLVAITHPAYIVSSRILKSRRSKKND